jgi:hypothetical protein
MSRRGGAGSGRLLGRVPAAAAPLVGAAVLVGAVRGVDALWLRIRGVRPTQERTTGARLLHAALLSAALTLAQRSGLPQTSDDAEGRRPGAR